MLHAGGKDGWIPGKLHLQLTVVPGCDWVFKSNTGYSDYHDEMNATSFEEWFKEKLLPPLPPHTLIVKI